jgi:hypothetical protein
LPTLGLKFTEAAGKLVAFVNIINDPPNRQALEIRFTDGTLLRFEFCRPRSRSKASTRRGPATKQLIRNLGAQLTEREKKSRSNVTAMAY